MHEGAPEIPPFHRIAIFTAPMEAWHDLSGMVGRVNDGEFHGYARGTLKCMSARPSIDGALAVLVCAQGTGAAAFAHVIRDPDLLRVLHYEPETDFGACGLEWARLI